MSRINQISYNITAKIEETFKDKLHDGDLTVIRGILKIELGKEPEFRPNPLSQHWIYEKEKV